MYHVNANPCWRSPVNNRVPSGLTYLGKGVSFFPIVLVLAHFYVCNLILTDIYTRPRVYEVNMASNNSPARRISYKPRWASQDPVLPSRSSYDRPPMHRNSSNKRGLDKFYAFSSDPALFSSDDLPTSSADNYLQHRDKRQHRRAWYEEEESAKRFSEQDYGRKPRERGPFQRNFDSGVWLGDDETPSSDGPESEEAQLPALSSSQIRSSDYDEEDEDLLFEISRDPEQEEARQTVLKKKALQTVEDSGDCTGPVFPYWQQQPMNLESFHTMQEYAADIVAECEEHGEERVDLS